MLNHVLTNILLDYAEFYEVPPTPRPIAHVEGMLSINLSRTRVDDVEELPEVARAHILQRNFFLVLLGIVPIEHGLEVVTARREHLKTMYIVKQKRYLDLVETHAKTCSSPRMILTSSQRRFAV